jgi:GTP-dependent phosphoenolpyruvate carboxykinase
LILKIDNHYVLVAIDWAASNGHINVLEWFHNSNYKFIYYDIGNNEVVLKWFNGHDYKTNINSN